MKREFLRFLIGGGINTLATYLLFIALAAEIDQTVAYTITYIAGIALSYFVNAIFVFRKSASIHTALIYPVIYLVQYLLGLVILSLATMYFSIVKEAAMLIAIAANIPTTFLLSRWLLGLGRRSRLCN